MMEGGGTVSLEAMKRTCSVPRQKQKLGNEAEIASLGRHCKLYSACPHPLRLSAIIVFYRSRRGTMETLQRLHKARR